MHRLVVECECWREKSNSETQKTVSKKEMGNPTSDTEENHLDLQLYITGSLLLLKFTEPCGGRIANYSFAFY